MSIGVGFKGHIGIVAENTWGTEKTPRTDWFEFISESLSYNVPMVPLPTIRGRSRRDFIDGVHYAEGDINTVLFFEGQELLFKHLLGSAVKSANDSTWDHEFTPETDEMTGLTIEVERDIECHNYLGMKVTGLDLSLEVGGYLEAAWSFIGKSRIVEGTPGTPSYPDTLPIHYGQVVFTLNSVTTYVRAFRMSITAPFTSARGKLGSTVTAEPRPSGVFAVEGEIELEFDEVVSLGLHLAGTEIPIQLVCTGDTAAGAESYTLTILMPRCRLMDAADPQIGDAGPIVYTIPFMAVYDNDTPDDELTITLRNLNSVTV